MRAMVLAAPGEGLRESELPAPEPGPRPRFGLTLRAIQVRLRFIGVLAVAFVVVGQWETLRNYWGFGSEPVIRGYQTVE